MYKNKPVDLHLDRRMCFVGTEVPVSVKHVDLHCNTSVIVVLSFAAKQTDPPVFKKIIANGKWSKFDPCGDERAKIAFTPDLAGFYYVTLSGTDLIKVEIDTDYGSKKSVKQLVATYPGSLTVAIDTCP